MGFRTVTWGNVSYVSFQIGGRMELNSSERLVVLVATSEWTAPTRAHCGPRPRKSGGSRPLNSVRMAVCFAVVS